MNIIIYSCISYFELLSRYFIYKIKTVDIALTKRSRKEFFKESKSRIKKSLENSKRDINKNDKYLRDSYTTSATARNMLYQSQ